MRVISLALGYHVGSILRKSSRTRSTRRRLREIKREIKRKYCIYNKRDGFICHNASVNGGQGETSSYLDIVGISLVRSEWITNYARYIDIIRKRIQENITLHIIIVGEFSLEARKKFRTISGRNLFWHIEIRYSVQMRKYVYRSAK